MVGTQKIVKTFSKILLSSALYRAKKFKKIRFFEKSACFTAPILYMQLLDCHATYHWKELFKRKRMTYYLSKINMFLFGKVISF